MKKAFIKGTTTTIMVNSASRKIFIEDLLSFYDHLRVRGFPHSLLQEQLNGINYSKRQKYLYPDEKKSSPAAAFLALPYNATFCSLPITRILAEDWMECIGTEPTLAAYGRPPMVSWMRSRNVADIINIVRNRQRSGQA